LSFAELAGGEPRLSPGLSINMPSFEADGIAKPRLHPQPADAAFRISRLPGIEEKGGNGATSPTIISEWKFTGIL